MTLFIPVGRIASEPSTRESASGRTCCTFSFAVDTGVKDSSNNKVTNFLSVTAWGKLGELVQNHLHKGDAVSITGKFCARPYTSKKDSTEKISLDLNATDIDFLPGGKKDSAPKAEAEDEQAPRRRRQRQEVAETAEEADDDELPF